MRAEDDLDRLWWALNRHRFDEHGRLLPAERERLAAERERLAWLRSQ